VIVDQELAINIKPGNFTLDSVWLADLRVDRESQASLE
jgi:hypothetical protein